MTTTTTTQDDYIGSEIGIVARGKEYTDKGIVAQGKDYDQVGLVAQGDIENKVKQVRLFSLSDTIKLRQSSVYTSPRQMELLKWVYGDLRQSKVKCLALDEDGTVYHIADHPVFSIDKVYVDGVEVTSGFRKYKYYQDETGHAIAYIEFSTSKYEKEVSVGVRGKMNSDGTLMDNPSDQLRDILLNLQEYDESTIDIGALEDLRAYAYKYDKQLAFVIDDDYYYIRDLLDDISNNLWAFWSISDGQTIIRFRGEQ